MRLGRKPSSSEEEPFNMAQPETLQSGTALTLFQAQSGQGMNNIAPK